MKIKNLLTTMALTITFLFIGTVGWGQIIISQYYEGTANNKWIELTNVGSSVDLTSNPVYLLMIGASAAKDVTTTNPVLIASFNTGIWYSGTSKLIKNSSAALPSYATADVSSSNLSFNGAWDVVFTSTSNNTTAPTAWNARTDVVGEIVSNLTTSTSIADISYYRNIDILTGNGVFTLTEWTSKTNAAVDAAAPGSSERLGVHLFNDIINPELIPSGLKPSNGATNVFTNTNLTIVFNENIQKGTGSISIKKISDDNDAFTPIDVTSADVVINNAIATVTLPSNLANATGYYVNIEDGAFKDMSNNNFAGLVDKTTWTFTTVDATTKIIQLTKPNGGEKYMAGQTVDIKWMSANMDAENIKIEAYVRDGLTTNWNWIEIPASQSNDGSEIITIPADATSGSQYKVRVTGLSSSTTDESDAGFTIIARPTINQIQSNNTAGASAWLGESVRIEGVITAVTSDNKNYYLQNGSGAWNGIYVYLNAVHTYAVGNRVIIEGIVDEYNGLTQIKTVTETTVANPSDAVPAAVELTTLATNAEDYESVLVKVVKAECKSGSSGNYTINDGSGDLIAYKGIYGAFALTTGRFYDITGVMTWYSTNSIFELLPRNAADVYELSNDPSLATFTLNGQDVLGLTGISVNNPETDLGATMFVSDFTGFKGIATSATNANATVEIYHNTILVPSANYADETMADGDVVVADITAEDGTEAFYKVKLKFENRTLAVTAPTGGQTYNVGDVVTITWTSTNIENVNVWAFVTGANVLVPLNTTPISAAAGTFDYTIQNGNAGIVYIRVSDATDDTFYAQSAGTVTVVDGVKPTLETRYPSVNKYGIAKSFTLELNYDENIMVGSGNLKIFKASDNSEVFTAVAAEFNINGKTATVSVSGLDYTTTYYVTVDAGLFKDESNNQIDAIAANDWKFTTTAALSGDLFFSEYIEGSSNNKALEIYNPTSEPISLNNYRIAQANDGGGWAFWHTFPADKTIAPGDVWVIITNTISTSLFDAANADEVLAYPAVVYHNGNDARGLEKTTNGTDWTLIDVIGDPTSNVNFDVAGVTGAGKDHTLIRKSTVVKGNSNWAEAAGTNADNSEWIVKNVDDFTNLGSHTMTLSSANAITEFSIANQVSSTIDANAKTISVVMPYGVALTNLTPTITLSYGAYTIPASGVAQDFSSAFEYVAIAMDGTANVWTVTVTNAAASSAKEIVSFSIPSQVSSTIVAATSTINVVVPTGTNLTSLTPTITLSPYATIDPASGVARNFSSAVTYTVTAQDGSTKVWTVNVSIGSSAPDQPFASFKAYPNPFSNEIRFDGAEIARVTITSIIGQVVMDKVVAGENLVETQSLSKGIYLVKFTNIKGESVLRKLIKE